MSMSLLEDWCRGMEVDIHRCLLIVGIPEGCGQAEIEGTLNGVLSPLGPYRVLNKMFLREENAKVALIEVGEGVNLRAIPREFPGRGGVWRVVCRDPTQDAEFLKNLNEFLDAEGRTWEDVVRLLQLSHPPSSRNRSLPPEHWAEALGVMLGAVVQIVFYMDAEIRKREEAGALEALEAHEAQLVAASAAATGQRVKKEPGRAVEVGSALKIENLDSWNDAEDERDPPKPLVRRAGAKTRSRRKKQKKNSKQEPASWKKPRGHCSASSENPEAADGESMEISECTRSSRKPCVKQEEVALKKPVERGAWKLPRNAAQDAEPEAGGPAAASESNQDGGRDGPPKKKAMGWASAKSPASGRKKKKVSLGPVSYVLVDVEDAKKKPLIPKKGSGSRRGAVAQRAPRGPQASGAPASTSQGAKAKPEGSPHGEHDDRSRLRCVHKRWSGGERKWERQVGADEPQGSAHHVVSDEDPSAVEVGDPAVEVVEGESPDLAPRSP